MSAPTFASGAAAAADRSDEIRLVARTYSDDVITGGTGTSTVTFTLKSDGDLTVSGLGIFVGTPGADEWNRRNILAGLGAGWDVRATVTEGTLSTGLETWQQLNADRTWTKTVTGAPTQDESVTLTFDYRLNGSSTILVTVTGLVLQAQLSPL